MKWDKLESFLRDHRHELDELDAPDALWQNIEAKLPSTHRTSRMIYWKAAAVVFFVLSLGLLFKNYQTSSELRSYTADNSEFNNTEQYYFKVIHEKEGLLTKYLSKYPNLADDFKNDLSELSLNYKKLKKDFDNTGSEEVLNALIKNLQLQQELLNNQLNIIHLIKEENENVSI